MAAVDFNTRRSGCYLGQSDSLNIINEEIVLLDEEGALEPGTVLGRVIDGGTQTVAAAVAAAGNTGNGTVGSLTGDAGAEAGTYQIVFIEPGADAGKFQVEDPSGNIVGTGTVGVAFNGPINFTVADGATDFVSGDRFTIAVSYASGSKYAAFDQDGTDGREIAAGILFHAADSTDGDVKTVATVRGPATINGNMLIWPDGIEAAEQAVAERQLRDRGLAILPQHA